MRQPDRLQGEGEGGGKAAAFCRMCDDRPTVEGATLTIRYCVATGRVRVSVGRGRRREARGREGREYESHVRQKTEQDMEGQSVDLSLRFVFGF